MNPHFFLFAIRTGIISASMGFKLEKVILTVSFFEAFRQFVSVMPSQTPCKFDVASDVGYLAFRNKNRVLVKIKVTF